MAKGKEQKKYKSWPSRLYPSEIIAFKDKIVEVNDTRSREELREINQTLVFTHFMRFFIKNPEKALKAIKYDEID